MKYYETFEEKGKYFTNGGATIDNFSDLIVWLEKLSQSNRRDLYRGQPEAKYKLYSSLQRLWLEKKLTNHYTNYVEIVKNLIENCKKWNNGVIEKYLKYMGAEDNRMGILSIMQHYGVPTPLLDFTLDVYKSLYFAIQNIDISPANNEIENYFSIYIIYEKNIVLYFAENIMQKVVSYPNENNFKKNKDLDTVLQFEMVLIDNMDEAYRIQNNINIINQDGVFIFNSSPDLPLEAVYPLYKPFVNHLLKRQNSTNKFNEKIGTCLNINKRLVGDIRKYLQEKGINNKLIYPNLDQLKSECLNIEYENIRT